MFGIVRYTKMKTATNIYIFNLALADALATSTLPFQSAKYLMETWPFGELLCKVVLSIDYYNMFTSIFTLTMMSVDRYIAVCHPVKALDFRTPAKAKLINICIWVLASGVGVPIMVMAVTRPRDGAVVCMLQFPNPSWYWDTVTKICVFLFAFVVPILVITVCYGLMLLRLRSVRLLSGSKEKDRSLRRITRMVLVVVGAFVVCWAPIHIFVIVWTLVDINRRDPLVVAALHLCIALGYANSSLNPVLYAFLDENFKRCFRQLCRMPCGRREPSSFSRAREATARERVTACTPSDGPGVSGSSAAPATSPNCVQLFLDTECLRIPILEVTSLLEPILSIVDDDAPLPLGGSTTWQIASYFCHTTLDTAPANSGAPSARLCRPSGSATLPAIAGRPVRPHLEPSPLPGCDALSAPPSSSPVLPAALLTGSCLHQS
ncbi:PREDICTED: delta-type opioid receptor [Bison bison bison]|uniref:Delta-type opioid receptor n=1 Tax=Bison bison bison TaxID=43346 RepID=A0A6P3GQ17_BISBB|nr:PREDICTED: delta-type opioid receptor [Bison bison bison]